MNENCCDLLKEVNGLIGAIDGDTLSCLRKLISQYDVTCWQVEEYYVLLSTVLDNENVPQSLRSFIKSRIQEIRNKVRKYYS